MEVSKDQIRVDRYWLVVEEPNNPPIRLDARYLDRVFADEGDVIVSVGKAVATIWISFVDGADETDEAEVALQLAGNLARYTRSTQIMNDAVYQDAKRRLELASRGRRDNGALALFFGNDDVFAAADVLTVGRFTCQISEVERYAAAGASLPLPNGRLDAELAMLVVAARDRKEDLELLARRVEAYEARLRPT